MLPPRRRRTAAPGFRQPTDAPTAFSTCHGVTGRLCDSQIVLPSSETEGAVIAIVDSTMHTAAAAMGAKRGMLIPTASDSTDRFS